jgi:hypothetical protein
MVLCSASHDLLAISDTIGIVFSHHGPDYGRDYSGPLSYLIEPLQEKTCSLFDSVSSV